jgi:flagellar assembly factor FliW
MPILQTKYFGDIPYQTAALLEFPAGLPGFEGHRRFLPVHMPENEPLVFLQSAEEPGLCFVTLPVLAAMPGYRLSISAEDLTLLGFPSGNVPRIGGEVLCLAIVTVKEGGPTANLLAPIVINLANQRAVQAIGPESGYSWEQPLLPPQPQAEVDPVEAATC